MLVLSRKIGERIRIGDDVTLTVVRIHGDKVRLGIEAPDSVTIHREEVYRRLQASEADGSPDGPDGSPRRALSAGQKVDASLSSGQSAR